MKSVRTPMILHLRQINTNVEGTLKEAKIVTKIMG
jgi:hypothetical protein